MESLLHQDDLAVAEVGPVVHFLLLLRWDYLADLGAHSVTNIGLNPIPGSFVGPCCPFSRPLDWIVISGTIVLVEQPPVLAATPAPPTRFVLPSYMLPGDRKSVV